MIAVTAIRLRMALGGTLETAIRLRMAADGSCTRGEIDKRNACHAVAARHHKREHVH